ncbi:MAG: RnfABCDGE type electron transport complex subunit C [Clostridiales bacterium]|nr:RnfABCDGE type electron transport complex subunit C [Clostridiales bacterium]
MKRDFSGGITIPPTQENKQMTSGLPVEEFAPDTMIIPLRQSGGVPCLPAVKEGETVLAGQAVGTPAEETGVPIHCGVSGTVLALEERPGPFGKALSVVIKNDYRQTPAPPLPVSRGRQGLLMLMRGAGLVGMGGAGFPVFRKYQTERRIDDLLINGAECEPYLTCDDRLMTFEAARIAAGAAALAEAVGNPQIRIHMCVEKNKPGAIARLREASRSYRAMTVEELPHRYPQGGERQLIHAVLGREVPAGRLPADVGALVSNAATAAAMADALEGRPLTHRLITVSGAVARPANVRVPIGTLLSDLLAHCGGPATGEKEEKPVLFVAGGPMTGTALDVPGLPVIKTTAGLILLPKREREEHNCIRCGGCARVCPSRLMPFVIDAAVIAGETEVCADYRADQCIACGCCSWICPAGRRLAARVSMARRGVQSRLRRKAAHAR